VCAKCTDRNEDLEKCQQDLENCQQDLEKCQQDLEKCQQDLEKCQLDLKSAIYENFELKIDKFILLKAEKDLGYYKAEEIYVELTRKWEGREKDDPYREPILNLKYEYAAMQIEHKKYPEAEKVAREVLIEREGGEEVSEDYKSSHRQLILALRRQGRDDESKLREAEHLLRKIWPIRKQRDLWKLENGDMLCTVLEERRRYDHAHALQKNVWEARAAEQGKRHKDTIKSALRLAEIMNNQILTLEKDHKKTFLEEELKEVFAEVWGLWEPGLLREQAIGILTAGYKLGHFHGCRQDYLKAKPILSAVWEGMKSVLEETSEDTISAGVDLASVYFGLKEYPLAESTSTWVWEKKKVRFGIEDPRTLEARYDVGRAALAQGERHQYAKSVFDEVYKARKASRAFGPLHKDTLACGHYLSEAIAKQEGGCLDAAMQIKEVFELRKQVLEVNDVAVLESGYLYGCLLFELAASQNAGSTRLGDRQKLFQMAEEVFNMLWQTRDQKPGLECAKILESGRCLAFSQIEQQKYIEASSVLKGVWTCKKEEAGLGSSDTLKFGHRLGQSLMEVMSRQPYQHEPMGRRPYERAVEILTHVWAVQKSQGQSGTDENLSCGYSLGVCLMELGRYEEAKKVLEVVWEKQRESTEPENSDYAYSLGVCLVQLKEYTRAKSILESVNFEEGDDRRGEARKALRIAKAEIRKAEKPRKKHR